MPAAMASSVMPSKYSSFHLVKVRAFVSLCALELGENQ